MVATVYQTSLGKKIQVIFQLSRDLPTSSLFNNSNRNSSLTPHGEVVHFAGRPTFFGYYHGVFGGTADMLW